MISPQTSAPGSEGEHRPGAHLVGESDQEDVAVSTLELDAKDEPQGDNRTALGVPIGNRTSGAAACGGNDEFGAMVQSVLLLLARAFPNGRSPYALAAGNDLSDLLEWPDVDSVDLPSTFLLSPTEVQESRHDGSGDRRPRFGVCAIELDVQNLPAV